MSERMIRQLQEALDHAGNTHTISDVVQAIQRGECVIWHNGSTVALTETLIYPRLRAMRIWLVAGDENGCDDLLPQIEEHARSTGCQRIEAIGRFGWKRYCAQRGYRQVAALYRKELEP